jgi:DNA-binding GntR family transcriptional regulator
LPVGSNGLRNFKLLTLPEQIALQIRQDIYNESYKKGEFLRETELAKRFNVSRGPVRQALSQLANEGLLEFQPNIGVRVSDHPSEEAFSLIVKLRRTIETFVIKSIFNKLDDSDLVEIEGLLEDVRESCESGDIHQLMLRDYAFHEFFMEKYGDKHILSIWSTTMSRMMMRYTRFADLMNSYEEHRAIVEAIRQGQKQKTAQAFQDNIQ